MSFRFQHRAEIAFVSLLAVVLLLAAIALASPDLVALGSLLVIPFLVLYPAPTVAFYLLLFALGYIALRRRGLLAGVMVGSLTAAGVGLLVPKIWNAHVESQESAFIGFERMPRRTLTELGLITIIDHRASNGVGCGALCSTLLYSGLASEVTIKDRFGDLSGVT